MRARGKPSKVQSVVGVVVGLMVFLFGLSSADWTGLVGLVVATVGAGLTIGSVINLLARPGGTSDKISA